MADASTEPKPSQTEPEKPLHGDEKATEAPKETAETTTSVCLPWAELYFYYLEIDDL